MKRYYTATSATSCVREYMYVSLTVPLPSPSHPLPYARPGGIVVADFFERIGPDHPETLFAIGFKSARFRSTKG